MNGDASMRCHARCEVASLIADVAWNAATICKGSNLICIELITKLSGCSGRSLIEQQYGRLRQTGRGPRLVHWTARHAAYRLHRIEHCSTWLPGRSASIA